MTEEASAAPDLGLLLESARTNVLRISVREAARRSGIVEGTWRHVVRGGRTTDRTIVAMALGVGVGPADALAAAGLPVHDEHLDKLIADIRPPAVRAPSIGGDEMAAEVERIKGLPLSAEARLRMIRALVDLYEQQATESRRTA